VRRAVTPALVLAFTVAGCATTAPPRGRPPSGAASTREAWSESDLPETDAEPPRRARADDELAAHDLQARLAVRARSYLGRRGPFQAKGERFGSDCSGFVEAVYAAEGILLRGLMQRAAPDEGSGVAAAWEAARNHGRVFGAREWPAPGDLVFWHDTYDRNRNARTDDRFTHLGIVEYVEDGTVTFLHRGGRGVVRGVMTPGRPGEPFDPGGRRLNSPLRATSHPRKDGGLAGELLAGYGRIDLGRIPSEYASERIDPFFGEGADRDAPAARATSTPTASPTPSPNATRTATATATPIATSTSTAPLTVTAPLTAPVSAPPIATANPSPRATPAKTAAKRPPARKASASKKATARSKQPVAKGRPAKAKKTFARGAAP
jgi:hypothetical protein